MIGLIGVIHKAKSDGNGYTRTTKISQLMLYGIVWGAPVTYMQPMPRIRTKASFVLLFIWSPWIMNMGSSAYAKSLTIIKAL
jgi:hypothetical protein